MTASTMMTTRILIIINLVFSAVASSKVSVGSGARSSSAIEAFPTVCPAYS